MGILQESIHGRWIRGKNAPRSGTLLDFRAGRLVTNCDSNLELRLDGPPSDFSSDAGDCGDAMLAHLMTPPTMEELRYGAFREAVAFANGVASYGFGETRAWESKTTYVADTGEGSCGIVQFGPEGCVAAMINYDPHRFYDVATHTRLAPAGLRVRLSSLCSAPMLNSEHQRPISAVFWSEGGPLTGSEPWPILYRFGAEVLRREILNDDAWFVEAQAYYEPEPLVLETAVRVARRLVSTPAVRLSRLEERTLIPQAGPYAAEARRCLRDAGILIAY